MALEEVDCDTGALLADLVVTARVRAGGFPGVRTVAAAGTRPPRGMGSGGERSGLLPEEFPPDLDLASSGGVTGILAN